MVDRTLLQEDLHSVEGKPVSPPIRSHGSMFILDLGKLSVRQGDSRAHGQWCLMFEQAEWSFLKNEVKLVSWTDDPRRIDAEFRALDLKNVKDVSWMHYAPKREGLRIEFSNGVTLRAKPSSDPELRLEGQWSFFTPFGRVWTARHDDIEMEGDE